MGHSRYVLVETIFNRPLLHASDYQGMPTFKQALAEYNSPLFGREFDPETEISVHSGASEALLSAVMAFVEPGEEVILLEPVFSAYVYPIFRKPSFVPYF